MAQRREDGKFLKFKTPKQKYYVFLCVLAPLRLCVKNSYLSLRLKGMICQDGSHIDLPEKRFEIRAEAVENRNKVFFI